MRTAGILLFGCLLINTGKAWAATEFGENIPTNLAKIFAGMGPTDPGLYADINDEFPPFTLPPEFMVLGSIDRGYGSTVYLSTALAEAAARQAIVQAFVAGGWQEIPFPAQVQRGQAGFTGGSNQRAYPTMLCHDDFANLQINTSQSANEVLMTITHQERTFIAAQQQSCSATIASREQINTRVDPYRNLLEAYLPRLELPLEAAQGRPPGGAGGLSGGNDVMTTYTDLTLNWNLAEVFDFFAMQIEAQGWTPDGEGITALTAGGSWTRSPAEDVYLLGRLSIVKRAANNYKLEFDLISLPSPPEN